MPPRKKGMSAGARVGLVCGGVALVLAAVLGLFALARSSGGTFAISATPTPSSTAASSSTPTPKAKAKPSTKVDNAGQFACDDFAGGYKSAQTRQARVELANKVNEWAPKSKSGRIADMGALLGRGADASAGAWTIGADAFAQACFDAGWGKR